MKKNLLVVLIAIITLLIVGCNESKEVKSEAAVGKEVVKSTIVGGSCGMCTDRVEKTASEMDGVKKVSYDLDSRKLTLTLTEGKSTLNDIEKKLASIGHDAGDEKADDKVYNALPGCCMYRQF
jgi:copper chaperone CopZ